MKQDHVLCQEYNRIGFRTLTLFEILGNPFDNNSGIRAVPILDFCRYANTPIFIRIVADMPWTVFHVSLSTMKQGR